MFQASSSLLGSGSVNFTSAQITFSGTQKNFTVPINLINSYAYFSQADYIFDALEISVKINKIFCNFS